MRFSKLLSATLREAPSDAESISHQLMLRAGLVRRFAAGVYGWLPVGWRVLRKVEQIVRQEMDRIGCQEILLPSVQPAELWQESGRWQQYGPELLRFTDRHQRDFCLGPTHEEIITDLVRREVRSYKQLPLTLYQIQSKFRDEIRPRFGIMRAREFLMKDAYSFHLDKASLEQGYQDMYEAYSRILRRLKLRFRAVRADSGNIGGHLSHEFHVIADSGEDRIAYSTDGSYAANIDLTPAAAPVSRRSAPVEPKREVDTPGCGSIEEVSALLGVPARRCVKTLLLEGARGEPVALVLRGDHELNRLKAERLEETAVPLCFAGEEQIVQAIGCRPGSLGPLGLKLPVIVDHGAAQLSDFVCGANREGKHLCGVNWGRDLPEPRTADLRNVVEGDRSPDGNGELHISRGIEVGHIFQLGTRYSAAMRALCLDREGKSQELVMGCYGIGVSRLVPAAIEQNHDDRGIIWPAAIAPWQLLIIPINMHKSQRLRAQVEVLYAALQAQGIEVLLDDRRERPGVMYNDAELLGIPHWFIYAERGLDRGIIEYRSRTGETTQELALDQAAAFIRQKTADTD